MISSMATRRSVKRNLFGSVDHEQIQEDLKKELAKISEEKSKTWNFDFKNFKPLPPGRYKWERVGKRLQARLSPTDSSTTNATESQSTQERAPKRQRYNLRTRERDVGNEFRPIDSPDQFNSVSRGVQITRPVVNTGSTTGSILLAEEEQQSVRTSRHRPTERGTRR